MVLQYNTRTEDYSQNCYDIIIIIIIISVYTRIRTPTAVAAAVDVGRPFPASGHGVCVQV